MLLNIVFKKHNNELMIIIHRNLLNRVDEQICQFLKD